MFTLRRSPAGWRSRLRQARGAGPECARVTAVSATGYHGDCLEFMRTLPATVSTGGDDPPYG